MKIEFSNIPISLDAMLPGNERRFLHEIARACGLSPTSIHSIDLMRKSVDARKKSNVHFVVSAAIDVSGVSEGDIGELKVGRGVAAKPYVQPEPLEAPDCSAAIADGKPRPVIVGSGPAGLFCALYLALAGLRPIVVERGKPVEQRVADVEAFANGSSLNPESNVQFGEGGAGTFSDGKLTTGTKSPHIRHVLEEFVEAGACGDILVDAKPHIGTDMLPGIVANIRRKIVALGGQFMFNTRLVGIEGESRVEGVTLATSEADAASGSPDAGANYADAANASAPTTGAVTTFVPTDTVVLAIGHSARDTFQMLLDLGIRMERKPFAVGVRIEHLREDIDKSQYGRAANHPALGAADYKMAVHNGDGRGVFTFCMCPGGSVVAAASEEGGVCVNGMSANARDGGNSNAALLASVNPDDLPGDDVLEGVRLQRDMECAAYEIGIAATGVPFTAPAETVGDFMSRKKTPECRPGGSVAPSYPRGVAWVDLRECLPGFVADAIEEAMPNLGRKLRGFDDPEAVMTGVEARSSSPVRIVRDSETMQSASMRGLYPAGEGAGYAGGIMSAATDGIRVAEAIVASLGTRPSVDAGNPQKPSAAPAASNISSSHEERSLRACVAALQSGDVVIFPTDTVVGIGSSTDVPDALDALYKMKGRDAEKPVAWLVGSRQDLLKYGECVPDYVVALADAFWPGPLTLVVAASSEVDARFRSIEGTIGLRMPASSVALQLVRRLGVPVATTSANRAGEAAPCSMGDVDPGFAPEAVRFDGCLKRDGECGEGSGEGLERSDGLGTDAGAGLGPGSIPASGTASTVVDCTGSIPCVLRAGTIPSSEIIRIATSAKGGGECA